MITNGFTYIAVLVALAAVLIGLEEKTKAKFFKYAPPVVLLYLITMICCTFRVWDLESTRPAYTALKNNVLFAMIFLMLLRCDIRKILKLGPRMLFGFFSASISIGIGFVVTYAIMHSFLGSEAWRALAALCGSWMGGSGNMIAIQAALDIDESSMAYALVIDTIAASVWVMFLLWSVSFAPKFNKWTKSNVNTLEEVGRQLEKEEGKEKKHMSFQSILILLGSGLLVSALTQNVGNMLNGAMPFLDKSTWTVIVITILGLICAVTPFGKIAGSVELSNVLLYIVISLLASRASLLELTQAPIWILAGFMILIIHGVIMIVISKIFKLDMFTCAVASLANIGGTASAPILAGSYSTALVPVGVLMALMGYVIGTGGGLIVARIMEMFA